MFSMFYSRDSLINDLLSAYVLNSVQIITSFITMAIRLITLCTSGAHPGVNFINILRAHFSYKSLFKANFKQRKAA